MGLDIGDGRAGFSEEDGTDAKLAGSSNVRLEVVEEDDLFWLHTKALTGQFKDAPLGLGNSFLMGVNDPIGHLIKMVALLLSAAGTDKAVAEEGGLIVRTQAAEVGS